MARIGKWVMVCMKLIYELFRFLYHKDKKGTLLNHPALAEIFAPDGVTGRDYSQTWIIRPTGPLTILDWLRFVPSTQKNKCWIYVYFTHRFNAQTFMGTVAN